MTWVVTAVVAVGTLTAVGQARAGKAQKIELDQQAEEEKLSAEARELGRRQQLNKVLSANIASLAASGISGEGTPASLSLESAKQASVSEGLEGLSSRLKQSALKRRGKNAAAGGLIAGASTLLSTGVSAAQLSKPQGKT